MPVPTSAPRSTSAALAPLVGRLALDTALAAGAALRITRFATTDTLGGWVLVDPLKRWADDRDPRPAPSQTYPFGYAAPPEAWRHRLVSALDCPYCVGTQATLAIALLLHALPPASPSRRVAYLGRLGRLGRLAHAAAAALAASYLVGHISYRLDTAPSPTTTPKDAK